MPLFENLTSTTPLQNSARAVRSESPAGRTSNPLRADTTRFKHNDKRCD